MKKRLKVLFVSFLIVVICATSSFAIVPLLIEAGKDVLVASLAGTSLYAVLKTNSAYITQKIQNATVADVVPGYAAIRFHANLLWNNYSNPAQPVTYQAPVTMSIPISTVKATVLQNKTAYPTLFNAFYDAPVVLENANNTLNVRFYSGFRWEWTGVEYSMSSLSVTYNADQYSYLNNFSYTVYREPNAGDIKNTAGSVVAPNNNPSDLPYFDVAIHAEPYDAAGHPLIVYRRYQVVGPSEKVLNGNFSISETASGEAANLVNQLAPSVTIMDGYVPLKLTDIVGTDVVALPVAATKTEAVPLVKADIVDAIKSALDGEYDIPLAGTYDTSISPPSSKSISTLLSNLFANSPLAGMVRTFTINTSGQSAIVEVGEVYGKPFKFDFTRWQSYLVACGSILLVIVHGFAILIVMRGWKNG